MCSPIHPQIRLLLVFGATLILATAALAGSDPASPDTEISDATFAPSFNDEPTELCSKSIDIGANSDDDAACASICSVHFVPGTPGHRACVECCYNPSCQ
jgi:hypothetical protein